MNTAIEIPHRISVIEDEPDLVESLQRGLERKGHEVTIIAPTSPRIEDTIEQVLAVSDGALCDHHLQGGLDVDFSGAEVVAALTERGFPAVLFTGVLPEQRYAIRRNMARIPAFLPRDAEGGLRPKRVLGALADSVREVQLHEPRANRMGRRTPVTVLSSRRTGNESLVELLVSGWPGRESVEVPADLLAEPWAHSPRDAEGKTFFAYVNIGEEDVDKLFFDRFETEPVETETFFDPAAS